MVQRDKWLERAKHKQEENKLAAVNALQAISDARLALDAQESHLLQLQAIHVERWQTATVAKSLQLQMAIDASRFSRNCPWKNLPR